MRTNKLKGAIVAILTLGLINVSDTTMAQVSPPVQQTPQQPAKTNFTDAEINQFVDANVRLMTIQQDGEKTVISILEEEKISIEKFNEMAIAHQQQKLMEVGATAAEMAAFNKAAERIVVLQPEMQKKAETAILKDGMKIELYEQILLAYQQDLKLQEKVNKLIAARKQ